MNGLLFLQLLRCYCWFFIIHRFYASLKHIHQNVQISNVFKETYCIEKVTFHLRSEMIFYLVQILVKNRNGLKVGIFDLVFKVPDRGRKI